MTNTEKLITLGMFWTVKLLQFERNIKIEGQTPVDLNRSPPDLIPTRFMAEY